MPTTTAIESPARPPDGPALLHEPGTRREAWRRTIAANQHAILLVAILLCGTALRLYGSSYRSMWFDEAASWRLSRLPWNRIIGAVGRDNNVPLHHAMLKLWTSALGDSMWSMRGLSAALSGVAMLGAYGFAREAFGEPRKGRASGRWIGLLSAALLAVSLPQIRAGWEVRMYSLGTALVALGGWTMFRALHSPPGGPANRRWAVHGLVTLGMAYTHPYLLFSVAAQALFLAGYFLFGSGHGRRDSAMVLRAAISYGAVAAGWGLWVPLLYAQARQVQDSFWTGPLSGWDVITRCYEMFLDGGAGASSASASVAAACCAAILLGLALAARPGHWYALLLAAVPFGAGAAVSFLGRNIFVARYLVFAQLYLVIGLAALVAEARVIRVRYALAAALLVAGVVVDVAFWLNLDVERKPGLRAAVAYVERHRKPGEPVIVTLPNLYFPTAYYMHDRPACRLVTDGRLVPHYNGGAFVEESDLILTRDLARFGPGRVWVVSPEPRAARFDAPVKWRLIDDQEFREVFQFNAVFVDQFDVPAG